MCAFLLRRRAVRVYEWVAKIIKLRVNLFVVTFIVRHGRLQRRVPVHQPLAAVDQTVAEEPEERLAHGLGTDLVHGEPLPVPIARATHLLELVGDRRLVFVLERLDLRDELLTRKISAAFLLVLLHPLFDHGLGGDPRVICAGHPERLVAFHAVGSHEDVLDRVVEGVPEVQRGRYVGRRDDDAVGLGLTGQNPLRVGVEGF